MTTAEDHPADRTVAEATGQVLDELRSHRDAGFRADMGSRYGIHTDDAIGVRMPVMKALAKRLGTDHALATALWDTGVYEARIVATMVADATAITPDQMDAWCRGFDNWAICDTACFNLFDRTPHAWAKVEQWAASDEELVKRTAFALLWSLALHDRDAHDDRFRHGLALLEREAGDERHLVHKALVMAIRAVGKRRPTLLDHTVEVARRLAGSDDAPTRRVGRAALKELDRDR